MWPDLSLSGRSPPAKSQLNLISALQWGTAGAGEKAEKLVGSLETRLAEARSRGDIIRDPVTRDRIRSSTIFKFLFKISTPESIAIAPYCHPSSFDRFR
jgi:hypothetical protein